MKPEAALRRTGVWLLAGLLYLVWPWDIVPDFIAVVGWVDDLVITGLAVYMAYRRFQDYLAQRPGRGPRPARKLDDDEA